MDIESVRNNLMEIKIERERGGFERECVCVCEKEIE